MRYASVALDIPSRSLSGTFTYAVPTELAAEALVGATVLVTFSRRTAVGYVLAISDTPPDGVDVSRVLAVEQVLAPPAFDEAAAREALVAQGLEPFEVGRVVAGEAGAKGKVVYDDER